ncbi:MAG: c-type cytochrome [Acidobacteriota bacterium]
MADSVVSAFRRTFAVPLKPGSAEPTGVVDEMHIRVFAVPALVVVLGAGGLAGSARARQATPKGDPEAAKVKNPAVATPESIAMGKKTYDTACAGCHGADANGGLTISVIEDRGGKQPPSLVDDAWDHGPSDGEIFTVIKKGVGPDFFMAPWDGRISDADIWNTVNYVKSLAAEKK